MSTFSPNWPPSKIWLLWNPTVSFSFRAQRMPAGRVRHQTMRTSRTAVRTLGLFMRVSPLRILIEAA